jgi:hypothetical protein
VTGFPDPCPLCGGTLRVLDTTPGYVWLRCSECQQYRAEPVQEARS